MLEASADTDFIPDIVLADGSKIEGDGWALEGIHTPDMPPITWCSA